MTVLRAGRVIENDMRGGRVRQINFSGTVVVDGLPAIRTIKAYKIAQDDLIFVTESNFDGTWELAVPGNCNDTFRFVCVGKAGENSVIYEHVTE